MIYNIIQDVTYENVILLTLVVFFEFLSRASMDTGSGKLMAWHELVSYVRLDRGQICNQIRLVRCVH